MPDILLVDDDRVILEAIGKMLARHFSIAGLAANGKEALDILANAHVDAILTDISMPVMNGLELIEHVSRRYRNLPVVVLSNYDDFIFIKEAMRLGAADYLRKGDLDEESTAQTLMAVLGGEGVSAKASLQSVQRIEQQHFWQRVISGAPVSEERAFALLSGYEGQSCVFITIRFQVPPEAGMARRLSVRLAQAGDVEWMILMPDTWLMLAWRDAVSQQAIVNMRSQLLIRAISTLNECAQDAPYYILYDECTGYRQLVRHVRQTGEKLSCAFYEGYRKSAAFQDARTPRAVDEAFFTQWGEGLGECIRLQPENFSDVMEDFFRDVTAQCFFPAELLNRAYILLIKLMDIARNRTGEVPQSAEFLQIKTMALLKAVFSEVLIGAIQQGEAKPRRTEIIKAEAFIHKHYTEDLTLEQVAAVAAMSRTHFSAMFKKETGYTFVEYINHYRIERAKKHLMSENYKVYEIAGLVGISDYRYFCRLFRRYTGKQPTDYKYNI